MEKPVFTTKGFPLKNLVIGVPDKEKQREEQKKKLETLFVKR